jgi:ABC-type glycerol-3-phosphate transport system permease component
MEACAFMKSRITKRRVGWYVGMSFVVAIFLFPIIWMAVASLKPSSELFDIDRFSFFPKKFVSENYVRVLTKSRVPAYFLNSSIVALSATGISVVVASLGGYAISRFRTLDMRILGLSCLASQTIPGMMLVVPLFLFFKKLQLINTYQGLILAHTTFSLPFSIWMLRSYFDSIPAELEEAAMIDGCSRFGIFWRIVFPLCAPGVVAVAIFSFMVSWNEFLFALVLTQGERMRTLPIGIQNFITQFQYEWGSLLASGSVATFPILILFLLLQKYLVQGLTAGAIKE